MGCAPVNEGGVFSLRSWLACRCRGSVACHATAAHGAPVVVMAPRSPHTPTKKARLDLLRGCVARGAPQHCAARRCAALRCAALRFGAPLCCRAACAAPILLGGQAGRLAG